MEIRLAERADLDSIVEIYNHYVVNDFATFYDVAFSVEDRQEWFDTFSATGPYRLVVADGEGVCGYASSIPHRRHVSFAETVEFSVYLLPARRGEGLGSRLYARLIEEIAPERLHRAVAGIALPNEASVKLHRRFGFREVGVFDEYARLRGRYISSLWMQRDL